MAIGDNGTPCTVVLHDNAVSKDDVLCGGNVLPEGRIAYLNAPGTKTLCVHAQAAAKNADEVSIHVSVAKLFGFENRKKASIHVVEDEEEATATHVELSFRDQHLSRADMWRIEAQIDKSVLYCGRKVNYLGFSTASVEAIYTAGQEVESAYVSNPHTKYIFRSGSSRFTILIQISKEMVESWIDGDLMYERLIYGFLPDLFRRWDELKVRHHVTVVLFGRRLAQPVSSKDDMPHNEKQDLDYEDFFYVVASSMPSSEWRTLLRTLKRAFNGAEPSQQTCLAADGNMLQAIDLASMDLANERIDPPFGSTGTSIIAITAGAGLFKADYQLLWRTTRLLMGNSIGVDIVSLAPKPLHPVPLFQYMFEGRLEYSLPHWADISHWNPGVTGLNRKWLLPNAPLDVHNISIPSLEVSTSVQTEGIDVASRLDTLDEDVFRSCAPAEIINTSSAMNDANHFVTSKTPLEHSVKREPSSEVATLPSTQLNGETRPSSSGNSATDAVAPTKTAKLEPRMSRPLMPTGRKISLGPRGLALSQGAASTTVSAQHALTARETSVTTLTSATEDTSSGLAKQIRESLKHRPSQRSLTSRPQSGIPSTSKPIDIHTSDLPQKEDMVDPTSLIEKAVLGQSEQSFRDSDCSLSGTPRANPEDPQNPNIEAIETQRNSMTPWLTLVNPCNPRRDNMRVASEYRQWQNIFPKAVSSGAFKWDSICTPAALPLITENRASITNLENNFNKKIRRLLTTNDSAHQAMLRMIALRLIAGFQIAPLRKVPYAQMPSEQIERILLSLGGKYHEIRCLSDAEVQVAEYERVSESHQLPDSSNEATLKLAARIKTLSRYKERPVVIHLNQQDEAIDWASLDDQSLNSNTLIDMAGLSRARFVLIPIEIVRTEAQTPAQGRDLSDEERRLDGIQRLTQLWRRNRYVSDEDKQHNASMEKPKAFSTVERDPNPLAIEYQTRDPSAVVSAYGAALAGQLAGAETSVTLFAESELYHSSNFDMVKLVKQLQESPPTGVELRDRRWFTRLHLKCFRGDEMTNWLLRVFKDLQTREDAVALGNQLMAKDIFTHVRGKHEFRDGNYFYQIRSAHRTTDYPDTTGLFTKGIGRSVPSTPIVEFKQSPAIRAAQADSDSSNNSNSTSSLAPADKKDKKEVMLSQMLQYNVDPGKKSGHLEVVNLHYDRIHNPDNCYHIQLDWTSTTPKLIRESVTRWTSLVQSYGLRVVQLPLVEASKVHEHHPFDQPTPVRLAARPPERILATPHLDPHGFSPRQAEDPDGYHKALLQKLDFVLDLESASSFPHQVDVSYSWGRPSYGHTQFIHKSGLLLAQVSNDGQSDYLLVRNRLAHSSTTTASRKTESHSFECLVKSFTRFCRDETALKKLFEEVNKPKLAAPSPLSNAALAADSDIPPMDLPPHLIHRAHKPPRTT